MSEKRSKCVIKPYSKSKQLRGPKKKEKSKYVKPISKKGAKQYKNDEEVYEEVWNRRVSKCCEECGRFLGEEFRDWEGRINDRRFYSHILTKGANPEMREDPDNFNLLCPQCHNDWEFATQEQKERMNIWPKNKKTIEMLRERYNM